MSTQDASTSSHMPSQHSSWAHKYRGATVEDLDPPPALSLNPTDSISHALSLSYSHDYTHLTILTNSTRSLLGYLSIPHLKALLAEGTVTENDEVGKAMMKFQRKGKKYEVITMETPLEDLERFFFGDAGSQGGKAQREFAVVTDEERRFVLGVATVGDLERFVERRPS